MLENEMDFENRIIAPEYASMEDAEVETSLRTDPERLKAFITAERDEFRLPYARSDTVSARRTSLSATCNSQEFLTDPTGSRRFWTVPVEKIDQFCSEYLAYMQDAASALCAQIDQTGMLSKEDYQSVLQLAKQFQQSTAERYVPQTR